MQDQQSFSASNEPSWTSVGGSSWNPLWVPPATSAMTNFNMSFKGTFKTYHYIIGNHRIVLQFYVTVLVQLLVYFQMTGKMWLKLMWCSEGKGDLISVKPGLYMRTIARLWLQCFLVFCSPRLLVRGEEFTVSPAVEHFPQQLNKLQVEAAGLPLLASFVMSFLGNLSLSSKLLVQLLMLAL